MTNPFSHHSTIEEVEKFVDALSHEERINLFAGLNYPAQEHLFSLAKKGLSIDDLIPHSVHPLKEVIFHGRNSMPIFNRFQKRMARMTNGQLVGYNHQSMQWLTGPGYFVIATETTRSGELMVNYSKMPDEIPNTWPKYADSNKGISKLVYGGLTDFLRRISKNMVIGEAIKNGKRVGFFTLCREDL